MNLLSNLPTDMHIVSTVIAVIAVLTVIALARIALK